MSSAEKLDAQTSALY